ncbi:MAG: Glyoxalase-like domain protein [Firmicutes bacterium ADurb.Bin182]|nr:MAG: Glyoxalase-like domain protein [Firmicutes bacterium ADurb.Bin182]
MDTKGLLPVSLDAVVLECKDVAALSDFYIRLLGWNKNHGDDEWAEIVHPSGGAMIAFQKNEDYIPPVWPDEPAAQQQMVHLDFTVRHSGQMELAVKRALSLGAVKARVQYGPDKWITMTDPAGHPFCFVIAH